MRRAEKCSRRFNHFGAMSPVRRLLLCLMAGAYATAAEACLQPASPPLRDPSTWTCVEDDRADFLYCNLAIRIGQCETNQEVRNLCKATCGVCKLGRLGIITTSYRLIL